MSKGSVGSSGSIRGLVYRVIREFFGRSIVKNVLIMALSIILVVVLFFFPYSYYSSDLGNKKTDFKVGVHYVFEADDLNQIYGEVGKIAALGFTTIRITINCVTNETDQTDNCLNQKVNQFFNATNHYNMSVALAIGNADLPDKVNFFLDHWGGNLTYVQVLNEPELSTSWSVGSLFTDDELFSKFNSIYSIVESHHLNAKLYTNFEAGYIVRSNVPIELSKKLDFVGYDVYMDSFLVMSPHFIQNLQKITNKEVVVTEFGVSTSNSTAQTEFIINGLNLFRNMGLNEAWICYWNSVNNDYGIRTRTTEKAIGDWIADNTL
jgi:hypothetical protein